ncbi:hypothetical protein [Urechidicola vernalis]|uniref:Uncharacterized protein n=1 Tax=Urechidicola vernalis TaxID=3075600 RepID=A0ABU2Y1C3_9FLAO|nr:hypothetical protein [Urechidicola sp. P050]MDT0551941.1 hypothetical protein [Urechidicola sp. P050]
MRTIYNLLIVLAVLTTVIIASSGFVEGLLFFLTGASIISIGRYAHSIITHN